MGIARKFEAPDWFKNGKFGIWAIWGPQSVPMYGDWYARFMYVQGTDQYNYHYKKYGHPTKVGWKDICAMWKAEKFDPDALMDLYVKAGAKFFVAQAMHHDNFDNYNSKYNRFNAVNMGPCRDIIGEWKAAAKKRGLPFGVSEHLAASYCWWAFNKGSDRTGKYAGIPYDASNPEYFDFYHNNQSEYDKLDLDNPMSGGWLTDNEEYQKHWRDRICDLIDKYQPEMLYSDSTVPFGQYGLEVVAHLYNTSIAANGGINQSVYTLKEDDPARYCIGAADVERGVQRDIFPKPWQSETCIGNWFYDVRARYKSFKQVIEMLVDVVSKNGTFLLNIPQKPDGTLDDESIVLLERIGEWFNINGEAIYDTVPWYVAIEGDLKSESGMFNEKELAYTTHDFRFTKKGDNVYAFALGWPTDGKLAIRSFDSEKFKVESVELLGYEGKIDFEQTSYGLILTNLPANPPVTNANAFKVKVTEL